MNNEDENTTGRTKIILWVVGIFLGLAVLGAIVDEPTVADITTENKIDPNHTATINQEVVKDEAESDSSEWEYWEQTDELRGATDYYASITSSNEVDFDFPYQGGSRLKVTVRKTKAHGEDVIFSISDGQYICGVYDCTGMISFDGTPEKLTLVPPADHDSKILFAKYSGAIIKKLKSADKVIIELTFYREGNRQFSFSTKSLKWDH